LAVTGFLTRNETIQEKTVVVEVKVPVLAESVAEASILKWHKKPGDKVKRGDSLTDIETDKVTLEVAAPNNGILKEILKEEGADVTSNEVIARIETSSDKVTELPSAEGRHEKTVPDIKGPDETISDKTVPDITLAEPSWAAEKPQPKAPISLKPTAKQTDLPDITPAAPKLSPAVRNLLSQHKLDANTIMANTGKDRISKEDVLYYINQQGKELTDEASASPAAPAEPEIQPPVNRGPDLEKAPDMVEQAPVTSTAVTGVDSEERLEKRVPMTRLRKRIAERLLSAQHENAILTTFNEVNMQPVIDIRQRYKGEFEKTHGVKLGFMSFFTRAAIEALKKFPVINASVEGDDIIYHGYFDIGIAVSSPRGLVVPILRDADSMSLAELELGIKTLSDKARDSKLGIEELTGGTFTITNGGVFGSLLSTPIINPPQSAILGMHKMQERPVAEKGKVVVRPMMYLALSYDHRIIDGREAVQFLVSVKEHIEDPARLLLQV